MPLPLNAQQSVTWDGGSARAVFGTTRIPFTKFEVPKTEIKTSKVRRLGEMLAKVRTPGAAEIADVAAEMLTSDYVKLVLPRMPKHGGTLIEFTVTLNRRHPAVQGSYGIMMDQCRIVAIEEGVESGENAALKKLGLSVMNVWERGEDGVWKCLTFEDALPSAQARALMDF